MSNLLNRCVVHRAARTAMLLALAASGGATAGGPATCRSTAGAALRTAQAPPPGIACGAALSGVLVYPVLADQRVALRGDPARHRIQVDRHARLLDVLGREVGLDYTCTFGRPFQTLQRLDVTLHYL